jgi:hypothetical protein
MSSANTAPRNAYEAADRLAAEGHHVHVVAEGESTCHTGHCTKGRP